MAKAASARSGRRARRARVWVPIALLALLLGGYVTADVLDVVPGVLTTRPEQAADPPYPEPSYVTVATADPVPGPGEGTEPAAAALQTLTDSLLADPAVGPGAGVLISDVVTGADLVGVNADAAHVPASTTKLLTATAAIAAAGADHRFVTRVVSGEPGQLVLVAGGDLMLAAGAGDPSAVLGHAGLGDLATQTAAALTADGVTTVGLTLDLGYYAGPDMPPRWDELDLASGDAMHMAPLAIGLGQIEGQRARALDPAGEAGAAFVAALAQAGITVTGEIGRAAAPADAVELATVSSAPLAEVAAYMLIHSENILAEGIGRLVAHEGAQEPSFTGAGIAVRDVLAGLGIDTAGLDLADTSGLSSTNRISPRTLVQTLLTVQAEPRLGAVARGLPVAGLEGTLAGRLSEPPAAGLVAAKTGTLRTVVALSGYVTTADGRLLAFAVLASEVPSGGTAAARAAVDTWTAALAGCGC